MLDKSYAAEFMKKSKNELPSTYERSSVVSVGSSATGVSAACSSFWGEKSSKCGQVEHPGVHDRGKNHVVRGRGCAADRGGAHYVKIRGERAEVNRGRSEVHRGRGGNRGRGYHSIVPLNVSNKKNVTVGGMKNSGRGTISTVSSARSTTQGNSGTNTTIMNDNLYVYLNNLYFSSVSQLEAEEGGGSTAKQTQDEGEEENDLSWDAWPGDEYNVPKATETEVDGQGLYWFTDARTFLLLDTYRLFEKKNLKVIASQ